MLTTIRSLLVALALGLAFTLAACGGDDDESSTPAKPAAPTAVTAADLDKTGEFWLALTPDLKDDLIAFGKTRLGEDRPDGATGIQAYDTSELVAEVDKQYANASKRTQTIFVTYTGANDTLAKAGLDDALDGLNQLCSGEDPPPECE